MKILECYARIKKKVKLYKKVIYNIFWVLIMLLLTNQQEIKNAQHEFIMRLEEHCDKQIPVKLGYQGGYEECSINWSQALGLWFHSNKIEGSRYWNVFGLSNVAPQQNSMLSIVCEINPPVEGLNRRVQGAFVQDDNDHILLVHRGKIGGGKPGIGRKLFFENYQGKVREINDVKFIVIGDIISPDFINNIKYFVQEVDRIKSLVP